MKPLFLLGRARRSVSTLDAEFEEFERRIGQLLDSAVMCGDLVFWPVTSVSEEHGTHHPAGFWDEHHTILESGLLSEVVIGELGKSMFASSETGYIDRFQDRDFMYGIEESDGVPLPEPSDGDDDWSHLFGYDDGEYDDEQEVDAYANRMFWTVGAQSWFDGVTITEDTPSFGRKLMIIIGRQAERRFLDGSMGQKLRAQLGESASVVFNSQHEDVVIFALEHPASPSDLGRPRYRGLLFLPGRGP